MKKIILSLLISIFCIECKAVTVDDFYTDLVTEYIIQRRSNQNTVLDDAFVIRFLANQEDPERYKPILASLNGKRSAPSGVLSLDFDKIKSIFSTSLDEINPQLGLLICENNRSWQVAIDAATWTVTGAAAVFTLGGSTAIAATAKTIGQAVTKEALRLALTKGLIGATRAALATNARAKLAGLVGTGGAIWLIGRNDGPMVAQRVYSLLSSNVDTSVISCIDLDHNEGCYSVCGEDSNSDLNIKVFQKILGKNVCVDNESYRFSVFEMNADNTRGRLLTITPEQFERIKETLLGTTSQNRVINNGRCDGKEDDIDMYFGQFVHDPETLEMYSEAMHVKEVIRIDD